MAADGGHELEGRRVREVGLRLEFRARLEQYAAEPVLAARVLAGQKVPLRGERPGGLYLGGLSATASSASGMPSAVLAMTIASRSSVLASPANSLEAPCAASPGRYARGIPASLARESAERARCCGPGRRRPARPGTERRAVDGVFPVGNGPACQELALARDDARPVRRFPDVEPYDDPRPGGWCHGGILQSVGRSEALPSTPTLPGRGLRARQFPISRSERRASSVATPPGPSEGQGQTAIRGRPIGGPSGLGQTVGHAPNDRHRSSSMTYLRL